MAREFQIDVEVLQAALVGLQQQRAEIEGKMAEIRRVLGSRGPAPISASVATAAPRSKRQLSAAARKSIVEAQKKRWAAYHAAQTEAPAKKERKISAAGRKRIAQATKKRWAAFRAKQAAAAARKPKKASKATKRPAKALKQVAAKPAMQTAVAPVASE